MFREQTVYLDTGSLQVEPDGTNRVAIITDCMRDTATGRVHEIANASMSLREAIKARRALTRTIRFLKAHGAA